MGEDINIFRKTLRRGVLAEADVSKFRQAYSRSEKILDKRINSLKGTRISMRTKRKSAEVEITKDSIKHIRNDIKNGYISLTEQDLLRVPGYMKNSAYIGFSQVDKNGKHAKNKNIIGFSYHSFEHNSELHYFNVKIHKKVVDGKIRHVRELYNITKKVKNSE